MFIPWLWILIIFWSLLYPDEPIILTRIRWDLHILSEISLFLRIFTYLMRGQAFYLIFMRLPVILLCVDKDSSLLRSFLLSSSDSHPRLILFIVVLDPSFWFKACVLYRQKRRVRTMWGCVLYVLLPKDNNK